MANKSLKQKFPFQSYWTTPSSQTGFDDDLAGRGSPHRAGADIRSHLDDLARRHPDLADQLRGFPGGGESTYSGEKEATDGAEQKQETEGGQDGASAQQKDCKIGEIFFFSLTPV